jgi:glucosyl-dolichyl phosphate glucuronosyltransferase
MSDLDLSVIVATCNRAVSIERLLQGFCDCEMPRTLKWEVLVVDNNSTDHTPQVLALAEGRLPFLRWVIERRQGVSFARNRGAEEAAGRFLFFMDDDAAPDRFFLTGIEKGIADHPEISCFGTKVISHFPDRPDWFAIDGPYALTGILGIFDLGEKDRLLTGTDPLPIGSGILIEKGLFERQGRFDTALGPKASSKYLARGEDTCFMEGIAGAAIPICYLPVPLVNHYPDLQRYDLDRLKRMYIGSGIGLAGKQGRGAKKLFGVPRYLFRQLVEYGCQSVFNQFRRCDEACVYFKTRYWLTYGMIISHLGLCQEEKP